FRRLLDVFFFSSRRRHTRFSRDWSSDVCSSDLVGMPLATRFEKVYMSHGQFGPAPPVKIQQLAPAGCHFLVSVEPSRNMTAGERSEERRVGKECRARVSAEQQEKDESNQPASKM